MVRRPPGDGTLRAGRDRHQGREEDPELPPIKSDLIRELGQHYFVSLLRFRIFTHKKAFDLSSSAGGLQIEYIC